MYSYLILGSIEHIDHKHDRQIIYKLLSILSNKACSYCIMDAVIDDDMAEIINWLQLLNSLAEAGTYPRSKNYKRLFTHINSTSFLAIVLRHMWYKWSRGKEPLNLSFQVFPVDLFDLCGGLFVLRRHADIYLQLRFRSGRANNYRTLFPISIKEILENI